MDTRPLEGRFHTMIRNEIEQPAFDVSFYTLVCIGYYVIARDALATEAGREKVKKIFRDALLAGGSFEALQEIPEFRAAMRDMERIENGEFGTEADILNGS